QLGYAEVPEGALADPDVGHVEVLVEGPIGQHRSVEGAEVGQAPGWTAGEPSGQALQREQPGHVGRRGLRIAERADGRVESVARTGQPAEPLDDVGRP